MEKYIFGKSHWRTGEQGLEKEWLMTNGLGGYANGTVTGNISRTHGGYLVASLNPPVDRYMILSKTQERLEFPDSRVVDLACQQYLCKEKKGYEYLEGFTLDIVPEYRYQVDDVTIRKTISLVQGRNTAAICYDIENGMEDMIFHITPLFNVREIGSMSEKSQLVYEKEINNQVLTLVKKGEEEIKVTFYASEGDYIDRSTFKTSMATPNYVVEENQYYAIDNRNGSNGLDSHYTPYDIDIALKPYECKKLYIICTIEDEQPEKMDGWVIVDEYKKYMQAKMDLAIVQDKFARRLTWSADSFITDRKSTGLRTIMAGYPWFTDWGRDTMIAFHGLCLCTGRNEEARAILESFSKYVKHGLIPNMFPSTDKQQPLYNTMDASLWYFYAVDQYMRYDSTVEAKEFIQEKIYPKLKEIIYWYKKGTDFSIHMDDDGLVSGGNSLDQITWMDVRVGDWVVTPRHGKPVEINALWYNALKVMEKLSDSFNEDGKEYGELSNIVKKSFREKFWNEETGCLYDVIDPCEDRIRPNQLWAVSLPYTMLEREQEKKIVDVCYKYLYSSYGMRSLSYTDSEYQPNYIGELLKRDGAYHMGTTWAYPIGAFMTSYCKVHDYDSKSVLKVKEMCDLFKDHMEDGCVNGIAEIFDGTFACTSRGCFNQAWSVGEVLRVYTEDVVPNKK